jgi:hypothetical protein
MYWYKAYDSNLAGPWILVLQSLHKYVPTGVSFFAGASLPQFEQVSLIYSTKDANGIKISILVAGATLKYDKISPGLC